MNASLRARAHGGEEFAYARPDTGCECPDCLKFELSKVQKEIIKYQAMAEILRRAGLTHEQEIAIENAILALRMGMAEGSGRSLAAAEALKRAFEVK